MFRTMDPVARVYDEHLRLQTCECLRHFKDREWVTSRDKGYLALASAPQVVELVNDIDSGHAESSLLRGH